MFVKTIFFTVFITIFFGCSAHHSVSIEESLPKWVYNPSSSGYIGGVGVCGTHINGKTGQRELAIARAIDDIARQMGVTVDNILQTKSKASSSGDKSVNMESYSIQTVAGATVTATIVDMWLDRKTGELYVYMRTER